MRSLKILIILLSILFFYEIIMSILCLLGVIFVMPIIFITSPRILFLIFIILVLIYLFRKKK